MKQQHSNPKVGQPVAQAPYNFVPLPETECAIEAPAALPNHNEYCLDRFTGWFDVILTTKSPLYVRAALAHRCLSTESWTRGTQSSSEFESDLKNKPDFFHTGNELVPILPGSSLRGMLRGIVEIAAYGKFNRVTNRRLFYRDIGRTDYKGITVKPPKNCSSGYDINSGHPAVNWAADLFETRVKTGYLRRDHTGSWFIEDCGVARVEHTAIMASLGVTSLYQFDPTKGGPMDDPNAKPLWTAISQSGTEVHIQNRNVWVVADAIEQNYYFTEQFRKRRDGSFVLDDQGRKIRRHKNQYIRFRMVKQIQSAAPVPGPATSKVPALEPGILVLTGPMQNKHLGFVFLKPTGLQVPVPNDPKDPDPNNRLVERFNEDQLTSWQMSAFPASNNDLKAGQLQPGDPVFYVNDPQTGTLLFFGRASLFRLPYYNRPIDLVPDGLTNDAFTDYADSLFGYIRSKGTNPTAKAGSKDRAYASRVFVTDATLQDPLRQDIWLNSYPTQPAVLTPQILSSPKPTALRHYLTQSNGGLSHYDSDDNATLRGHKLYWHQNTDASDMDWLNFIKERKEVPATDTQHTKMSPVRPNVSFSFRIDFENLALPELGALCWALDPAPETGQDTGHKLGMGKPYGLGSVKLKSSLHLTNRRQRYHELFDGDAWNIGQDDSVTTSLDARTAFELDIIRALGLEGQCQHLSELKRISMLLKIMDLSAPNPEAYNMNLQIGFKRKAILPDPTWHKYGGVDGTLSPQTVNTSARNINQPVDRHAHPLPQQQPAAAQPGPTRTGFQQGIEYDGTVSQVNGKGKGTVEVIDCGRMARVEDVFVGDRKAVITVRVRVTKVNEKGKIAKGGLVIVDAQPT